MKSLVLSVLFALALPAFAFEDLSTSTPSGGSVSFRARKEQPVDFSKNNFTEIGYQLSSINNGSSYTNLALAHDFDNGFTLGVRGSLPMEFTRESQTYLGQVFGRFPLMNAENILYIELTAGSGMFTGDQVSNRVFGMVGGTYGYVRRFPGDFSAGLNVGVNYATSRITKDVFVSRSTIVNHIAFTGGYYF